jgi:alkaline phosphatase D
MADGYPFTLGVASGSPTATEWCAVTRLASQPLAADGGMGDAAVQVRWEVADDERFARVVRRGPLDALASAAHSVQSRPVALRPRWFLLRFHAGRRHEPDRAGPARAGGHRGRPTGLRFGLGSCQMFEQGYFVAHRHAQAEDLDLMVFVGDYI